MVIVPVDKAAKNVGIICKAFYIQILKEEVVESGNFIEFQDINDGIITRYSSFLKRFNLHIPENKDLPFVYWTPKFHKSPIDFRYITSGRDTVLNELSKYAGIGLKTMLKLEKTQCNFEHKFDGIRNYYILDDNKEVIKFMVESNLLNQRAKYIKTFDFKTLYTKIPHNLLKENIKSFVSSVFRFKNKKFFNISLKHAQFSEKRCKSGSFDEQSFIELIDFLIDNCFVSMSNRTFQLVVGIPTGTNCASDLANIFLHIFEKLFVNHLVENHNDLYLDLLGTIFRYQDDLIAFGDRFANDNIFTDIYPDQMVIKNTNISATHVTYLDLDINIIDNKFIFSSYDKRNNFNFPIINYPNLRGNIPTNAAYGVFTSQLIRYSRINLRIEDFIKDVRLLIMKLLKQGYKKNCLISTYTRFAYKYIHIWARFGVDLTIPGFIDKLF